MSLLSGSAASARRGAALLLVISVYACSPAPETAHGDGAAASLDVAQLDVCARVPVADVALVLGADPSLTSGRATRSKYAADCTYTLGRADGRVDTAILWVYPSTLWVSELGSADRAVHRLGGSNFLRPTPRFEQVHVLVEGGVHVDARATTAAEAAALAELALQRLGGVRAELPDRSSAG